MKGFSLIELLVAIGISAVFLPALATGFVASREGKVQQEQRMDAISLLKESQEAVRSVREADWATFAQNGTFHPIVNGTAWELVSGPQVLGDFTRRVEISDVHRDGAGAIVSTGGTLDPSTKKIVTTVSWGTLFPTSVLATSYLTRYLENDSYTETTQTAFNAGTKTGVTIRATTPPAVVDDGEILLGAGGNSDWCSPTLITPGTDLTGQGIAKGVVAIEGKAYTGTGDNASGYSLVGINIANTTPPSASQESYYDGHKTNAVYAETDYAYIATDTNQKEVVIVRTSSLPYTEVGYFDVPGNGSPGNSVYVSASTGYVTAGDRLYNFDVSSKTGARSIRDTDGVQLAGLGSEVVVTGNYAYISIEGQSSSEMQVVDVSDPLNLRVVGYANIDGQSARDIFINETATRAYIAAAQDSGRREMFIVDISNKTGNQPVIGSYDSNDMDPNGLTVVPGNRVIMVGRNQEEYQVIDISSETSPSHCGGAQVDAGISAVASVLEADGDAYSYIVTLDSAAEFRIIEGGPGGNFASSGIFESQTFSPGYFTANNRFSATFSEPSGTDIKFQVALASPVNGNCPLTGEYTFIGPSGTEADYFQQLNGEYITFPFTAYGNYSNPGQCFRYKAFLTSTNFSSSPVLYDTTINYSP